ncbi:sensor histidine kinase [Vibrio sp. WXL210]|uniref:sensor histidine kinase n=1 Tax=Vibrio sp. WXL210 TaxID=3450709 RepID=UPI003EC93F60
MSIKNFIEAALITLTAFSISAFFAFKSQYTLFGELEHTFVNQSENLVVIKNSALQLPYVEHTYAQELHAQVERAAQELELSFVATQRIERDFPSLFWPSGTIIDEVYDFYTTASSYLNFLASYSQTFIDQSNENILAEQPQQLENIQSIINPDVHHSGVVIHEHLMALIFSANKKMVNAFAITGLMVVLIVFLHLYTHIKALRLAQKELEQSLVKAEQASHAKSLFLSAMSHELKTPMNGVLGIAEVLKDDDTLGQTQRASVEILIESGNHLLTLLDDILDYSKMEQNKLELKQSEFSIDSLVAPIESTFQQKSDEQGISFKLFNTITPGSVFIGDIGRVRQIMVNLLGNAFKFTQQGSISLSVAYHSEVSQLMITVTDTGIGIEKEVLDQIFQAFEQSEKGLTRSHDGAGLGLAIIKMICDAMGGDIKVESEIGSGSKFVVMVKLQQKLNSMSVSDKTPLELIE